MTAPAPKVVLKVRPKLSGFEPKFGVEQAIVAAKFAAELPEADIIGHNVYVQTVQNALGCVGRVFPWLKITVRAREEEDQDTFVSKNFDGFIGHTDTRYARTMQEKPEELALAARTTSALRQVAEETVAELKRLELIIEAK